MTLGAGIPDSVPCTTIGKVCGSGMKSVMLADQAIRCGDADIVVAGGQESMSMAPYLLDKARGGGCPPPGADPDFNGDGVVDTADLIALLGAFGRPCP